jgi:predicted permease
MNTFFSDLKYSIRQLIKSPGFTFIAVVSLALGIGANTAVFSLLNSLFLRTLPVPRAQELHGISWKAAGQRLSNYRGGWGSETFPYPAYEMFRDQAQGFSEVTALFRLGHITTVTPVGASTNPGMMVSGNFFSCYGAPVLIGRALGPEDDRPDAEFAAVISYRLWERQFGGDPGVIGQTMTLNKTGFTVIGVLPQSHVGPIANESASFYVPMAAQPQLASGTSLTSTEHWWVQIMARRTSESSDIQAVASLDRLFGQFLDTSRDSLESCHIQLIDAERGLKTGGDEPIWALQALVFLVLLIACANLASLLLARGAARRHEMTVRAALGAGRWRLMRQSLTESLVLSVAGAGLGLVTVMWVKIVLLRTLSSRYPEFNLTVPIDAHVLSFTLGAAGVTTLLCGLFPAWQARRLDPATGLKEGVLLAAPRLRLGKVLVATQIGLSVLLVFGAGLMIRTTMNLRAVDPGFNVEKLLVFQLNPGQAGYGGQDRISYFDRISDALTGLPGTRCVAFSSRGLLAGGMDGSSFSLPDRTDLSKNPFAHRLVVSDGFFETLGLPLLSGRVFNASDSQNAVHCAIANETFAQLYFPEGDVLGQRIEMNGETYHIVGLCRDIRSVRLREDVPATLFFPYRQHDHGNMTYMLRSDGSPMALVPALRKLVTRIDRDIPLEGVATQQQVIDRSIMAERLLALVCGALSILALALSCIGLFGLMAYHVARRIPEIGIRMALGARARDIAWPILREALVLAALGLAFGIPAALALTRLMRNLIFGVKSYDPLTVVGSIALLLVVALLAAWIPARRAAGIAPMEALRCE